MHPELTQRENDILEQIVFGFTNKEISRILSISEATVENHIHHIYLKLEISNRAQAVVYALKSKIVSLDDITKNKGNPS